MRAAILIVVLGCSGAAPVLRGEREPGPTLRDPAIAEPYRPANRASAPAADEPWFVRRDDLRDQLLASRARQRREAVILSQLDGRTRNRAATDVAESDMWSPCVRDHVRAQPDRARRALTAALARYATSCDGDRQVVLERPLTGGRERRGSSDVFLVGTFTSDRHEVALRVTYCGEPRPRADRAVLVSDHTTWTSLPLVFERDNAGCLAAQLPYTAALGDVLRHMIEGVEATVRFEGVAASYEEIVVGDEVRTDLRVMLDVVDALADP
ncbi:MAG: hypothetical protein WKG01_33160 [Kofleriaceae bacterium]